MRGAEPPAGRSTASASGGSSSSTSSSGATPGATRRRPALTSCTGASGRGHPVGPRLGDQVGPDAVDAVPAATQRQPVASDDDHAVHSSGSSRSSASRQIAVDADGRPLLEHGDHTGQRPQPAGAVEDHHDVGAVAPAPAAGARRRAARVDLVWSSATRRATVGVGDRRASPVSWPCGRAAVRQPADPLPRLGARRRSARRPAGRAGCAGRRAGPPPSARAAAGGRRPATPSTPRSRSGTVTGTSCAVPGAVRRCSSWSGSSTVTS